MNKLLIVEDNEEIIKGLKYTLAQENFETDICTTVKQVENKIYTNLYDLAILDIMLPDGTGYDICKKIKDVTPDTPIIFLTAKEDENDVVHGFDLGADDYIIKPFRNRELISRINNVLRRYNKDAKEIKHKNIRVDLLANRIYIDEKEVTLTALEYKIIVLLLQNKGKTLTREQILYKIWDYAGNIVNDNTLTVYIKRLRKKLGEELIKTVKGIGYRID